jgi:hypothetical protein
MSGVFRRFQGGFKADAQPTSSAEAAGSDHYAEFITRFALDQYHAV